MLQRGDVFLFRLQRYTFFTYICNSSCIFFTLFIHDSNCILWNAGGWIWRPLGAARSAERATKERAGSGQRAGGAVGGRSVGGRAVGGGQARRGGGADLRPAAGGVSLAFGRSLCAVASLFVALSPRLPPLRPRVAPPPRSAYGGRAAVRRCGRSGL